MRITELFDNGEFVVTAEVGPPKGIDASHVVNEAKALDEVDRIVGCVFIVDGVLGFELGRGIFLFCYGGRLLSKGLALGRCLRSRIHHVC